MVERAREFIGRHPRGFDAAVALFWTALSFANDSFWDNTNRIGYLLPVILWGGLLLFWRRQHPLVVFGLQALTVIAMVIIDAGDDVPIWILCGSYSLGAHARDRQTSINAFVGFLAAGIVTTAIVDFRDLGDAVAIVLVLTIGWVTGDSLRTQRAYQQSVLERAERAEALRDSLARRAVAEERTRIARDLHDVVAHSMSLMVVQAGAARRAVDTDPAAAVTALEAIESVGRNSLDEMRRILDVLRRDDESAETAPQPDLTDLDSLADEFRAAGVPVELDRRGQARELPPTVELTTYRIVQESLTNVLKHAGPATAHVRIDDAGDHLSISIRDDGRGTGSAPTPTGSQRGHVGIRERVAAFGGEFRAAPRLSGGYEVTVTLPLHDVEASP